MSHTGLIPHKSKFASQSIKGRKEIYFLKVLIQALQHLAMEVGRSRTPVCIGRSLENCSMTHTEGCCPSLTVCAPTDERRCFKPEYKCLGTLISPGTITREGREKWGGESIGRWTLAERERMVDPNIPRGKKCELKQWRPGFCKLCLAESLEQITGLLKERSSNGSL